MTGSALPTIGIDIGGTSIRAAVVDEDCRILATRRSPTPHTVAATERIFVELIGSLAAEHAVGAVGLAVAGFITTDRSRVMFAPHLAWRDDPVPERIADAVGLPVVMDHDVNSAAWAEYRRGAAREAAVALLVAIGTGIGAGLVVDGRLYRGAHGVAPELGHLVVVPDGRCCPCGKRGCWERYCSGTALADTARDLLARGHRSTLLDGVDPAELTGTAVAKAAAAGDPLARLALDDLGGWLGRGLAMAADVLDPDLVVIGGGVVNAAEYFLPRARAELTETITGSGHRPEPRIERAFFGGSAGIIGAALLAAESVGGDTRPRS